MLDQWRWKHVYHLVDERNWASVWVQGLRSTASQIRDEPLDERERQLMLRQQRRFELVLTSGSVLRDQRPAAVTSLRKCLVGCTPWDWYELLNQWVYLWVDPARLERQRRAQHPDTRHRILILDARRIIELHLERAHVTPINSGNATRNPAARSPRSFVPVEQWAHDRWASESMATGRPPRPPSTPPAELVIRDSIPDLEGVITRTLGVVEWLDLLGRSDPSQERATLTEGPECV